MVNFTILAGGFAVPGFIATYVFDSDAGSLTLKGNSSTGDNPSWIALHPQNKSILYAVNELNPGGNLQSFSLQGDSASLVDTVVTNGNGPTFTNPLSTGEVTAMNFGSPNASFVPTVQGDPLHFQKDFSNVLFDRPQGMSNPHMSLEVGNEVLVPDLGADRIWRVTNDGAPGKFSVKGELQVDAGAGPRHIAMQGDILLTVHETASTLTARRIPQDINGTDSQILANVTTVPPNQPAGTKFAAAEILVSQKTDKFPDQLIYVSNRNIGNVTDPAGDTIAIFQLVDGSGNGTQTNGTAARRHARDFTTRQDQGGVSLNLLAQVPTGLQQIRSMALGNTDDGGDEFIMAGANTVGGVAMLQRVDGGKNLTIVASNTDVANRTSFVFLPQSQ